jgi:hypothetical protein
MSDAPLFPVYTPQPQRAGSSSTYVGASWLNRRSRSVDATQQTVGGTNSLLPVVYGTQRVGGRIFALQVYRRTKELYVGVAWCHGEVDSVLSVQINDEDLPSGVTKTNYRGTAAQTADPWLSSIITGYADDLPYVCYSVFKIRPGRFSGFPRFNAVIKGQKISSSSGGAKAYSENPAYIIADFIENTVYGMGRAVDWTSVAAVASDCDAMIGSPSEKKRTLNLVLDDSLPGEQWLQNLRDYANCLVVPEGSSYRLVADVTGSSVYSFTAANISDGSMRLSTRGTADTPTMIEVGYTDTSVVPYREATYMTAPVTPRRVSRINRPGIIRHSQAVRYAEERLADAADRSLSAVWETFDDGIKLQVGDLVEMTHPIGLTAAPMRIMRVDPVSPGRWRISATQSDDVASTTVETPPETPVIEPPEREAFFFGWEVIRYESTTAVETRLIQSDSPFRKIGYPDDNFLFTIEHLGFLRPADTLTWYMVTVPAGLPTTYTEAVVDDTSMTNLIHDSHSASIADSTITLYAYLNNEDPWGPPIYFQQGTTDPPNAGGIPDNALRVEVVRAEQTLDITDDATLYFPTTAWVYYIIFMGPMVSGETVTFTLGGSPAANISITGLIDRLGNGFDQTAVLEIDVDEYDAALISETFNVVAETSISATVSPTLNFEGTATPISPYTSTYFGTWAVQYVDATPPAVTTNSYPQYFTAGEYHRLFLYYGYVWEDVGLIAWVVTQTAGTTRNLYVAHNYGYQWNVTRDTATDYAGTAYSLQAQYDGVDYGDPIVLTCEV